MANLGKKSYRSSSTLPTVEKYTQCFETYIKHETLIICFKIENENSTRMLKLLIEELINNRLNIRLNVEGFVETGSAETMRTIQELYVYLQTTNSELQEPAILGVPTFNLKNCVNNQYLETIAYVIAYFKYYI